VIVIDHVIMAVHVIANAHVRVIESRAAAL
jgi:hypothetical protein